MKQESDRRPGPHAGLGKRLQSVALALLMALGLLPAGSIRAEAAEGPQLTNLIIDRVYELKPVGAYPQGVQPNSTGFAPEVTQYTGTAYNSVDQVRVFPFAASAAAQLSVNGQAVNGDGYVELDVSKLGEHPVNVQVTEGGASRQYSVTVKKVDTDYRGRRPIVKEPKIINALKVQTDVGDSDKLLEIMKKEHLVSLPESRKNDGSYVETDESCWTVPGDRLPGNSNNETPVTLFTVDLGAVYSVSRIRAAFGPSNMGQSRARISVSTDGQHWETPVTKGNMITGVQWHQNVVRYEFGVSYDARYIRYEVAKWHFPGKELRMYQFMIFHDSGKVPEKQPAPAGAGVPYQNEARHKYLVSGQATVTERGLPMLGWTPSGGYGRGTPTVEEARQFGYDGPLFYDPDFENADYMLYNPDSAWGIAKAPFGGNHMGSAGEPRDFIPASMKDYIRNAISICFGDEGGYSRQEAEAYAKWFDWTKQHYPGIILHTNQCVGQWSEQALREYIKITKPDLITWDDYYGDAYWSSPSSIDLSQTGIQQNAARRLIGLPTWELYRKLAWEGVDGTGSKPIMFGQYIDSFASNHSQSNKNLVVNASILSGMKWLNFFRVEYQFDRCYLWDEDGTPTRGLLEWGSLIDRVHAIDKQLTRLNNDWMMFKIGQMGSEGGGTKASGFRRGNFDAADSAAKNQEFGLAAVEAESLSTAHGGRTGDVVLGYFKPLPGLYESELAEYFAGATDPRAFMVMNGLVAGSAERYNAFNVPAREQGSSERTRQRITLTADPAFVQAGYTLYEVDKDNAGALRAVQLDDNGRFSIVLGGGEANLYFWNTNTTAKASSQTEGAYASFAFDGNPETYWQASEAAEPYTLENVLMGKMDTVTIVEKGQAIQGITLEYRDADGSWKELGQATNEAGVWTYSAEQPLEPKAIRLKIQATSPPAIYEVQTCLVASDPNELHTLTVNDNTMGTGLFRFNYDSLWSYREKENNSGAGYIYPLEGDGHFSNWADAEASFSFYGNKVELLLRRDQAQLIQAAIAVDGPGEPEWKTGQNGNGSLVFEGLETGVHKLRIRKLRAGQAGIDGAKVSWQGPLPEELVKEHSQGPSAVQEYLDQRKSNERAASDRFSYEPASVRVKNNDPDNNGYNADPDEANGWVEHVQLAE